MTVEGFLISFATSLLMTLFGYILVKWEMGKQTKALQGA